MIVLDASVLIGYLNDADEHHLRADGLLAREAAEEFGVTTLTLAEVLVTPTREGRGGAVQEAVSGLEIVELSLPEAAAASLARLHHETRLKLHDCCVLLAARSEGSRIASFDERLVAAARTQGIAVVET